MDEKERRVDAGLIREMHSDVKTLVVTVARMEVHQSNSQKEIDDCRKYRFHNEEDKAGINLEIQKLKTKQGGMIKIIWVGASSALTASLFFIARIVYKAFTDGQTPPHPPH